MRCRARGSLWASAALALLACEGGGLPVETQPPSQEEPSPPDETKPQPTPPAPQSYWPLTQGSRWRYRISDPLRGVFEKSVSVLGPMPIPEAQGSAIAVKSVQPYLEELSWQLDSRGLVARLREEDRKDGAIARVTTWVPSTLKSLSAAQAPGWSADVSAHELTRLPDGSVSSEKDKVYSWRVVAVAVEVTVPAGTFKAMKVTRERPDKADYLRTYWLAPGVGKVREEGERTEELLDYEVK